MKTDKRLKRGLADLSRFFTDSSGLLPGKREASTFTIEPPQGDISVLLDTPQFICASFLDPLRILQPADLIRSLEILKASFQEAFLLSVAPSKMRHDAFARSFPIPDERNMDEGNTIRLHSAADRMTFGRVPFPQFEAMVQPKIASGYLSESTSSKKALVILDSFSVHDSANLFSVLRTDFLEVLDHGIFIAQADLNQLQHTYELIKFCLIRNPTLRCSLLLTGRNAGRMWELVYERLSTIISQFLGCDLGFLGWSEGEDFELNPDLLLEESGNARQLSFKSCLGQILYHPILSE